MNFWNNFAAKHPAAAKWVREGGLFVIVSNLITVFKYLLLQFQLLNKGLQLLLERLGRICCQF